MRSALRASSVLQMPPLPIGMETALYPAEAATSWRIVGAALIGALLSCVWFGWYLAVSLPVLGDSRRLSRAQAPSSVRSRNSMTVSP
jgi:hypothetical protein